MRLQFPITIDERCDGNGDDTAYVVTDAGGHFLARSECLEGRAIPFLRDDVAELVRFANVSAALVKAGKAVWKARIEGQNEDYMALACSNLKTVLDRAAIEAAEPGGGGKGE